MINRFARARKLMAERLRKDEGLYISYQANIAMLLYDEQHKYGVHNFDNYDVRNELAKKY